MTCLDRNSHCAKVCIFTIRIRNFSNFVALCIDEADTPVSWINILEIFGLYVLISRQSHLKVSSVRTLRWRLTFLFFTEPVSLNISACLISVLGLVTDPPGNLSPNLRRVSEQDVLLFIYILWIYTRSHNENSCLGMSQIAITTITTLTALMYNNNHNQ